MDNVYHHLRNQRTQVSNVFPMFFVNFYVYNSINNCISWPILEIPGFRNYVLIEFFAWHILSKIIAYEKLTLKTLADVFQRTVSVI